MRWKLTESGGVGNESLVQTAAVLQGAESTRRKPGRTLRGTVTTARIATVDGAIDAPGGLREGNRRPIQPGITKGL